MCLKWNFRHVTSAQYHPESNGLAEQTIQTLVASMERLSDGSLSNWKTHLAYAVMANQMMTHRSTGYSPFMMLYGREALVSHEVGRYRYRTWDDYDKAIAGHARLIWELHASAQEKMDQVQVGRRAKWFAQEGSG